MAKNDKDDNSEEDDLIENEEEDAGEDEDLSLAEKHKALIDKIVAQRVADAKTKIDKAYSKAEKLAVENAALKKDLEASRRKKLEEDGKLVEAKESELEELRAEKIQLEEALNAITRDQEIEKVLGKLGVEFRSNFARDVAVKEIRSQLTKDDDGEWVHKSGASLSDFVKTFVKDPEKEETLLKPKENSGTGQDRNKSGFKKTDVKLSELTNEQMLKLAATGKLGSFSY